MSRNGLVTLFLLTAAAEAPEMRLSEQEVTTATSLADLQACVTRLYANSGSITALPRSDGVALDFRFHSGLSAPGKQILTFRITDDGMRRHMTVDYRHPFSRASAIKALAELSTKCVDGAPPTPMPMAEPDAAPH